MLQHDPKQFFRQRDGMVAVETQKRGKLRSHPLSATAWPSFQPETFSNTQWRLCKIAILLTRIRNMDFYECGKIARGKVVAWVNVRVSPRGYISRGGRKANRQYYKHSKGEVGLCRAGGCRKLSAATARVRMGFENRGLCEFATSISG